MAYNDWNKRIYRNIEGELKRIFEDKSDFKTYSFFANGDITISVGLPISGEAILKISEGEHDYAVDKKEGDMHVTFYEIEDEKYPRELHKIKSGYEPVKIYLVGNEEYLYLLDSFLEIDRTMHFDKVLEDGGIY